MSPNHAPRRNTSEFRPRGRRRVSRKRRTRIPPKAIFRMSVLFAVVIVCGLGVTKLLAKLTQQPVVVQAAPSTTESSEAAVVAQTVSLSATDVMPCYSEDALVINYLGVSKGVSTHPLLEELHKTVPTVSASTAPVSMGGSGFSNINYWKTVNSDTKGWLKIPGTNINYPVVQGPYTNYYTEKGMDKNYSKQGVIWADSSCSMNGGSSTLSPNTVIYGHNWTNYGEVPRIGSPSDTHFAQLTAFQHLSFAKSHPYLWFSTGSEEMAWQIFAAFYTDIDFNYISSAGGQWIIDGAKARSEHIYDVPVSSGDKIITLSTCTRRFGPSNRQRFVVMAKLVSNPSSSVAITANPNPIRPNL
ncbi:SrtB family sortase [Hydrogenoanaerobacterium saccharovorans]|uniref:Sortase, SrtB family n=1 Tax=Hydrogenoanaerobacterium saccharovorans TaxID=474960 RepID=A0A1H8CRL4_9FIRM|nr:class B sortase [Hydrogenoanaerobacterium saccharovorans]RPF43245.1 SrtB family sortase [Hydrogenoanaerobacterium saccharovorans]SEM96958.1 sortase, SrtB family [Hydrogenoanaerobacterium saccharovorans]